MGLLPELKRRGASTALDLGCGVGRHALFLAEHGLVSSPSFFFRVPEKTLRTV